MTNNKVVVITGGTRGTGEVIAQQFANEGWRVAVLARHAPPQNPGGDNRLFLQSDVTQEQTLELAVAEISKKWGRIDVWINNAGYGKILPFVSSDKSEWAEIFNVNFWGTVNGSRVAIRNMLQNGQGGTVINIASLAGLQACPRHSAYSAAKAAVMALTRSLAVEFADSNIRVNAIAPGPLDTEGFRAAGGDPQKRSRSIPTRKMITPLEIAEACLFLAKPMPSMTGHTLVIDGGSAAIGCYATVG